MGFEYTRDKLKKLYEQGDYYLGDWARDKRLYLEKYEEYVQWIADYDQGWATIKNRYHVLFDFLYGGTFSGRPEMPIVRGNFIVGFLCPNGDIKSNDTAVHFLDKKKIESIQESKRLNAQLLSASKIEVEDSEETETKSEVDALEKLEKELAALMQRVEDSFGLPPSFFEKN